MNGWLYFNGEDKVKMLGIDHGGWGKVLARNSKAIVIKWPSHMYWSGRGERSYAPPKTDVFKIEKKNIEDNTLYVTILISWENIRKKKGK